GQIWMALDQLWQITGQEGQVTFFIANKDYAPIEVSGWNFKSHHILLKELDEIIATKKASGLIMYGLLMAIALLAIFDTQVLSIFRRQKEIGTYIALGMTRWQVVGLFTVEGSMYSLLATLVGSLYGLPLLLYIASMGIAMPTASQDMGVSVPERIFPVYGFLLILTTVVLVVISSTIVSFLPARKIAKMNPVDALKGKIQ
ncbi:MAG: FtsX-like permease family protein, partial [Spirosomataceae bacterium]